jgi:transcriptional regulator with GAF, ATPase, and Fis domain
MTVGAPIVVDGALWGVMTASWTGQDLPPSDAEERLAEFAELVDTAIANADSRDQLMARSRSSSASGAAASCATSSPASSTGHTSSRRRLRSNPPCNMRVGLLELAPR